MACYDLHIQEGNDLGEDKDVLEASQQQRQSQDSNPPPPRHPPALRAPGRAVRPQVPEAGALGEHLGSGTHGASGEKSPPPGALRVTKCVHACAPPPAPVREAEQDFKIIIISADELSKIPPDEH